MREHSMPEYFSGQKPFSGEAVEEFRRQRKDKRFQAFKSAREFYKKSLEKRLRESEYYGAPQVGFGQSYTHTFSGDDGAPGSLDYNA